MTPFRFEHLYRARDPAAVFATYFDPDHVAEQDRRVEVARREVLDHVETPDQVRQTCRVSPRRQLPAVLRPFVGADLSYEETVIWRKADDRIDFDIRPRVLNGRAHITACYTLTAAGEGRVRRIYEGEVTVEVRLIGGRIERGIIQDMGASLSVTAACTQEYLDRLGRT